MPAPDRPAAGPCKGVCSPYVRGRGKLRDCAAPPAHPAVTLLAALLVLALATRMSRTLLEFGDGPTAFYAALSLSREGVTMGST